MKNHLRASAAIVALIAAVGPAGAADHLPALKAPPSAAWSWSGFYLGGHVGYAFARDPFSDPFFQGKNIALNGIDPKGFLGGFQAGANWQSGAFVGGLELDLSATDIKGSVSGSSSQILLGLGSTGATEKQTDKFDQLGSARARLGYLAWPNVQLYGTGGLAWTRLVQTDEATANVTALAPPGTLVVTQTRANPSWQFGWVAGIGGEARVSDSNWLVRLEYLHYDFGDSGNSVSNGVVTFTSGHLTADVVRTGLSYKFGGDAFVAASDGAAYGAMPVKAPLRVTAPWTWDGFYIGAHAGYGWFRHPFDEQPFDPGDTLSGINSNGFLAGFQAGANWQHGSWVGGLEIDLSAANIKGSASNTGLLGSVVETSSETDKFDRLGSLRARLGYLATPSVLVYGTVGSAWTRFVETNTFLQLDTSVNPPVVNSQSSDEFPDWRFGWVAGIGAETRLGDTNWLARLEYLHYDFGDEGGSSEVRSFGGVVTSFLSTTSGHLTNDVVRAAVSYKLDGYPPAAAARASMPLKALARAAAWSWSGFYIGGHTGYGWAGDPFSGDPSEEFSGLTISDINLALPGIHSKGFLGGFQAGANWQAGAFVGGLEIDLSGSGIKGSSTASASLGTDTAIGTQTDKFDLLGSARVRLGYTPQQGTLVYGTGGLAWTRFVQIFDTTQISPPATTVDSSSLPSWRFGWVAGAGVENRLWDTNWLVRLEYLHYDFGNSGGFSQAVVTTGSFGGIGSASIVATTGHLTTDVVRVGFDYKLD